MLSFIDTRVRQVILVLRPVSILQVLANLIPHENVLQPTIHQVFRKLHFLQLKLVFLNFFSIRFEEGVPHLTLRLQLYELRPRQRKKYTSLGDAFDGHRIIHAIYLCDVFLAKQVARADLQQIHLLNFVLGLINKLTVTFAGALRILQNLSTIKLVGLAPLDLDFLLYLELAFPYDVNVVRWVTLPVNIAFANAILFLQMLRVRQKFAP